MNFLLRIRLPAVILALQFGCASYAQYFVGAALLDDDITASVEPPEGQYHPDHDLQGERLDRDLDSRIERVYVDYPRALPSREDLQQVARRFANDLAALFVADRLVAKPV